MNEFESCREVADNGFRDLRNPYKNLSELEQRIYLFIFNKIGYVQVPIGVPLLLLTNSLNKRYISNYSLNQIQYGLDKLVKKQWLDRFTACYIGKRGGFQRKSYYRTHRPSTPIPLSGHR